ncbi:centromere-associated protein E isoform X2 [Aquarana catesbeiana]|uniref:centromere-associated protein E isoform X2 n=1 Tax=Aquarana catesbeiana TaxID=8400 RepID=UPI003CC9E774
MAAAEEDAVKVCVRVRPIIHREQGDQVNLFWKAENSTVSQIDGTRSFHFDRVFNSYETTAQVYQEVAIPIIRSALHGYNGTIFAYGQTSSGKTYTMMGSPDCLGIIPQAVKEIFRIIKEIPSREFLLRVSYMEIYNETVTDLLCDSRKKKPLEIREDLNRNVYVADLNEELVTCPEHVLEWIKKGEKTRHYGETKMNEHSSRSHTIFRMIVESRESNEPGNSESCEGAVMVSHLNLVDLAGSERASQTGAEGVRLKEGCNINRSLFILGQVIKKLSDDQPGAFINYRDSKLTRILQNSLGGNTKTVIICTITPVSFEETLSTLQFASAAKNVKNKPHVNEVLDDQALLKRYRKEIMDLKKQLDNLEASSVSKAHAMANEELLAVIQQLQKEKEERISNLKNVVVDSARSQEDQQHKRKRRVTWGAEKIQSTLYSAGVLPFDAGSKISASFPKRTKLSDLQTIPENDDSVCTEFSETDETARVFEDFFPDWDVGSKITLREKTAFRHSMIDLNSDAEFQSSALLKDCSSPNHKELEQKLAELDNRLQAELINKESFEKETLELKKQLEAKEEEKDELVKKHQLEITTLKDQLQNMPEVRVGLGSHNELEDLDSNNLTQSQVKMNNSQSTQTDQVQENCVEEHLSSPIHDICQEQIQMLEQKIADLETSNQQTDFVESLQICEALMMEKETALNELAILRENFDSVVVENESMKQEIAIMEKYLQEKNETSEFELLEKETQKEHEAQLIHEIGSLKKVVKNAELYNQELEGELENKSKVLKEQEKLIAELKKDAEVLLKKSRYSDLSISMGGDSEKILEEVLQLKQSLVDAETVTRDAQREAAFLRSENIELKEKMDELALHCQQREKDASASEKQLESEKSNYKRMQADLQKELQCAFNEINQLNGLLEGRVPKDLLSRVELDKKIADCSKQLTNALEEKNALEKEISYLSELTLPSENEQLKNQVQKTSGELQLLKNEKEQSESIICDQNSKMQEQKEQIDKLIEEESNTQAKLQQAEQQYSELKILYEDLQTRCLLTNEEIRKKDIEAECQVKEINDLKHSLEILEGKLSSAQQEREALVQAQQDHASHTSSIEETLKSMVFERDNLQEELSNLSSLVETLQQQAQKHSELFREKQDLVQKHLQLMSEKEQLQEQLNNSQPLLSIMQTERSEGQLKIQELQEKITLLDLQIDELQCKVEELTSEKNILKQDLNDNIEMSIETQDELRTTQEELKCQKQLVSDLRKQISDYAELISVQAVSHKDTTEASEANSDTIGIKKMEEDHQSLISEMDVLKESLKSAELALATMEEEKHELMQKLDALEEDLQSVTEQRDELENAKNNLLVEKDDLKAKVERATKQVCELNEELKFLPEKPPHEDVMGQMEQIQEKEKLLETLKAVTDERDQLKLDLHDNIEMSIETQEELRNALDELKEKSRLFEALKSQVDGSNGQTSNLEKNLEVKILDLEGKLHAAVTERDQLSEELRFMTEQKRNLEEALSTTKHGLLDKETQDKEVQVLTEVLVDEEEMNVSTSLEVEAEQNILKERIGHLQQHIHIISQEREQYLQLLDTLKAENLQLVSVMQRQTEDRAAQSKETEDLASLIETLKEKLETTSQQLTLRDQEAKEAAEKLMDLNNTDKNISELEMLERNLQQSSISMEKLQGEKQELSDKLCALQEELEKVTCYRENLQSKLEIVLGENASLKEIIETASSLSSTTQEELLRCQELQYQGNVNGLRMQIPGSVSIQDKDTSTDLMPFLEGQAVDLEEQLLQKTSEYEQLLQMKDKLEEDQNSLTYKVESLTNRMTESQANLECLQNEKHQNEEQLLHLQQKLNDAVQDRDDLKIAHERLIVEMDQLKKNINEKSEMDLCLQEQLLQRTSEYEQLLKMKNKLEEEKSSLNCEVESLTNKMTEAKKNLESVQNENHQTEEQLVDLKQKLNVAVQDRDDLKIAQERLIAEIELLQRNLKENDEMVLHLKQEIQQRTECQHEELEQTQHTLKNAFEQTMNDLKSAETQMEALRSEKLDTEKKLLCLQHTMEIIAQERDDLKASQENLTLERDQLKEALEKNTEMLKTAGNQQEKTEVAAQTETLNNNELDQLLKDLNEMESQLASVQREKVNVEENFFTLQKHMEEIRKERDELQATLQSLQSILQSQQSEKDQLKEDLRENIEMLKTVGNRQDQTEVAAQTETLKNNELDQLLKDLKDMESQLASVQSQKVNTEEKFFTLQKHMEEITKERDELQATLQSLLSEKDQLKEDLRENIEMSIETQEDLRSTQEELQQQRDRVSELTKEVYSLEQKSSSIETELYETATVLKEITHERDDLDQCKQKLTSKVEQLLQQLKDKELALYQAEKDKSEASQKILDLSSVLSSMAEEKDLLNCSKEDVEKQSVEMQNYLRRTQEELQQQKQNVESLTSEISLLEEKCSSLQKELQEHITLLKRAVEEKEVLDQAKQKLSCDIEQLLESLKSKDTMLELTEGEKRIAAQKVIELTEEVRSLSCQIEELQLFKENLEKEATKLKEDFKQLQLQHAEFNEQETQKSARLEELTLEVEQLKEKVTFKSAAAQQLETDKADLQRQVQQYELEVASLHQEQEQFQQLLQRVRGEKENIYTNLQDQEKANEQLRESLTTHQTELESVKKQRDESRDHVTEKVNEINAMLQQLSSLQQQLQQLHQELKDERMKNNDLNEKVDDLEKEIRVLHLLQNEPVQEEEDELAERTESLQQKNQEFKDLMVTISSVYANQHHLLSNLSMELQDEVEAQKQSMGAIKESMSSTHLKSFESLQTEYFKLNSQMQTLLNKFKVIYRNAAVKEEQYSLVTGYDNELCVVQKKNDELLLQCQSLEQNGTKWSESAAEELKFCELEFLNHLIFKKMDVIKRVEDGFSEVQISLNSVEGDLIEEVKCKKKFLSWLEECQGLHFDAKCFSEGIIQENRRISGLVQLLSKKLKTIVQSRVKQDTVAYLKQLDEVLQEKKEKNKELLHKRQLFAPSGDSNILDEENARLCEKLKNLQAELKKMQCRIQQLENEVTSAKADAKQKGEKASRLQEKLLSSVTETALSEMQAKVSEKEKNLETALKEIKALQEKVAQGAAPYRDEMDSLKNQVVKLEMDRIKLSKSTDQQIASLKSSLEYKEECLRKTKEQLRRSQKDADTTICSDKNGSIPYPLTCGGGSGIVQSTTMLMLQSENASLKREITHYRKKCHQLSRSASTIREDELKLKEKSVETPSNLFSSLADASQSSSEVYKQATVPPHKSDIPPSHIHSPGNTGMHRKRAVSPNKTDMPKPQVMSPHKTLLPKLQVMSPNKTLRHSVPASSPGKTGQNRKRAVSPFRTEGQLFSNLNESPHKKHSLPEPADLPKDKLFEWSKSLSYCPSKFFDNSTLGTLPDADLDLNSGITTETNEVNNWWDRADKNKHGNECKPS